MQSAQRLLFSAAVSMIFGMASAGEVKAQPDSQSTIPPNVVPTPAGDAGAPAPPDSSPNPLANALPGLDNALLQFKQGQQPVIVPPVSFVDVNTGRFGKLEIDLDDAQFLQTACKHLHLVARNLDIKDGVLKSLTISVEDGHLEDFIFDHMDLATQSEMNFDTGVFLNHRVLQFSQPVPAEVTATISQQSLNSFLNAPHTLDKLSMTAGKSASALATLVGLNSAKIGLTISKCDVTLGKSNKITVTSDTNIGLGQVGLPVSATVDGKLGLKDGWLQLTDTHLVTAGQQIAPDLTDLLVKKIQSISVQAQKSNDLRFEFTDLKVQPNKQITLKGTAQIMRLRFGGGN